MIDDENAPEMGAAARDLHGTMARLVQRLGFNKRTVDEVRLLVRAHRAHYLKRGVRFPVMTLLVLPSERQILCYRADLTERAIQGIVVDLVKSFPNLSTSEIALAIAHAFPQYRPGRFDLSAAKPLRMH